VLCSNFLLRRPDLILSAPPAVVLQLGHHGRAGGEADVGVVAHLVGDLDDRQPALVDEQRGEGVAQVVGAA
jgi:hypothetical protein